LQLHTQKNSTYPQSKIKLLPGAVVEASTIVYYQNGQSVTDPGSKKHRKVLVRANNFIPVAAVPSELTYKALPNAAGSKGLLVQRAGASFQP
jgi:hypothetical protein